MTGGFIERPVEGTYFGHIVEHVALEMTDLAGVGATHGKTRRALHDPCCYNVVIEYKAEHVARRLLRAGVELVETLIAGRPFDLEDLMRECEEIATETELGPSTRAIVEAAERHGIPCMRVGNDSLVQLGHGKNRKFIQAAMTARDVGAAIIDMLYPEWSSARVPIISITGTNGKTTVTRMIGHVFSEMGKTVGMTTTDGIYIGGECVEHGDTTGPHSARAVLSDPSVEVAVLETARGGIARRGLGYDWSDVAIITNIQPDHIGQDGIKSLDDLVYIIRRRARDHY